LSLFDNSSKDGNNKKTASTNEDDTSSLLPPLQAAELLHQMDVANNRQGWVILSCLRF
jgi:hypothetical protein